MGEGEGGGEDKAIRFDQKGKRNGCTPPAPPPLDGPVFALQKWPAISNSGFDIFARGESFDGAHIQMCIRKMNKKLYYVPVVEKTYALDKVEATAPRKKVLLLDDDADLTTLTRMILETHGYEVETASDGVLGIKRILASDYSVILCDMVMPNLAGDMFYTAVERVKPHLCRRFLFMTGHRGDRKVDEFIRKVRGLILWKPFQSHVLMESIQAVEQKCSQG